MQKNLHPNWNNDATVTCACGNTFTTGSAGTNITVDICSACHPFFTGEMKFVDRQGRVDKFNQKMATAQAKQSASGSKKAKKQVKAEDQKSYRQLLQEQRGNLKQTATAA